MSSSKPESGGRHIERRHVDAGERHVYSPLQRSKPAVVRPESSHAHEAQVRRAELDTATDDEPATRSLIVFEADPPRPAGKSKSKVKPKKTRKARLFKTQHAHYHAGNRRFFRVTEFAKAMFRVRHVIQFAMVLGCLVWGGFQITREALAEQATPSTPAETVTVSGHNLDDEYPGLPEGVAQAVQSVVATQRIVSGAGQGAQNGFAGSGVVIDDEQIVTAGHNVEDGRGVACSQTMVVAPGILSVAGASKDMVTYASIEYGKGDDMAVLSVSASANFRAVPDIALAAASAQPGETVYFINYQPTADGRGRTPLAADRAYAEPVIFSATVLGSSQHGIAIATGGGKSFGRGAPDVMVRKGASGGAVVNADGQLLGLSVSSQSLAADRTAKALLKDYSVNLPAGNYQVAYMQAVSKAQIARLKTGMVACTE